jgi:integrase
VVGSGPRGWAHPHCTHAPKGAGRTAAEFLDCKTDRSRRELVLLPAVVERLRRYRAEQLERRLLLGEGWYDLDLVCDRGDGMWLTPDGFTDAFKRFARATGLPPETRLHDCRHAVATAMLAKGVHPAIASAVLGHSSPAFTMSVYQHVTDGMTEQAAVALEAALALPSEIRQKSGAHDIAGNVRSSEKKGSEQGH